MRVKLFYFVNRFVMRGVYLCAAVFLAYACSGSGQRSVSTEDPQEAMQADSTALRYLVDVERSYLTWVGSKITEQHHGKIGLSEGNFHIENGLISEGALTIDMQKLSVAHPEDPEDAEKLRSHLLSEDFFEAETYPTAYFELVSISDYDSSAYEDKVEYESASKPATSSAHRIEQPTHNVTGNLVIRGQAKMITFPARIDIQDGQLVAEAKFNIDRTDWGVKYGDESSVVDKAKDKFVYNTVNAGFYLEAKVEGLGDAEIETQASDTLASEDASSEI